MTLSFGKMDFTAFGLDDNADTSAVYKEVLHPTFQKILIQRNVPKKEWQDLFYNVHQYVIWYDDTEHVVARSLYDNLRADVEDCAAQTHDNISVEQDDQVFLQKYVKHWLEFHQQSLYANLPFGKIDEALLEHVEFTGPHRTDDLGPIRRMLMTVWNEKVLTPFSKRLLKIVADLLVVERDQGLVYGDLVVGVRDSFYNVSPQKSFFEDNYEQVYIATLDRYYAKAVDERFTGGNVVEYATWAENTFLEENVRAKKYLVPSPKYMDPIKRMNERLVEILVKNPKIFDAVSSEACRLIEDRRSEPLNVLFRLLDRVPGGLECVIAAVQDYIVRRGKEDMLESAEIVANDPEKYVEKLLSLFRTFAQLVKDAFNDDHRFTSARDLGFEKVVNDTSVFAVHFKGRTGGIESRCPEMLANFCDTMLRKSQLSRRLGSEEIGQRLKHTLQVLKYVNSKDIFMQIYQGNLARRLILGLTADSELEEEMSKWLANIGMPAEIISRINRMFSDIAISQDLSRSWQEHVAQASLQLHVGEMDPKVLNVCSWSRPGERTACTIWPDIEEFVNEFDKWYHNGKNQGRKLVLAGGYSTMVVQFASNQGLYDLELTMFQMAVLKALQSCGKSKLTFEAIQIATELPNNELRRTLWSLCTSHKICRNQLLGYAPQVENQKDLEPHTRFWINMDFAPIKGGKAQKRGRINFMTKLTIGSERRAEEEPEGIAALREFRVQEAITKVMKMRKSANIGEIHTESIEILKNLFLPNRKVVKEQIEYLIEKEYLSRDERDLNVFHYVA